LNILEAVVRLVLELEAQNARERGVYGREGDLREGEFLLVKVDGTKGLEMGTEKGDGLILVGFLTWVFVLQGIIFLIKSNLKGLPLSLGFELY
jgi:hypothetical protein